MRKIKFRAWNGKMWIQGIPLTATKTWANQHGPQDYLTIGNSESDYDDGSHWVIVEYTGLKDKNGKEVYEGDIVLLLTDVESYEVSKEEQSSPNAKDYTFTETETSYAVVEWGACTFKDGYGFILGRGYWQTVRRQDGQPDAIERGPFDDHDASIEDIGSFEVIGNIYENPELLK